MRFRYRSGFHHKVSLGRWWCLCIFFSSFSFCTRPVCYKGRHRQPLPWDSEGWMMAFGGTPGFIARWVVYKLWRERSLLTTLAGRFSWQMAKQWETQGLLDGWRTACNFLRQYFFILFSRYMRSSYGSDLFAHKKSPVPADIISVVSINFHWLMSICLICPLTMASYLWSGTGCLNSARYRFINLMRLLTIF